MVIAIAERVKGFIDALFGVEPVEAEVQHLPTDPIDLLVVGRLHLREGKDPRFGYSVVEEAVERCSPKELIYVIPGRFSSTRLERDIEVLRRVSGTCSVHVLEFPMLLSMDTTELVARARRNLVSADWSGGKIPLLLAET